MSDYIHDAVVGAFALLAVLSAITWTLIVVKAMLYVRVALGNRRFAARCGDRATLSMPTARIGSKGYGFRNPSE